MHIDLPYFTEELIKLFKIIKSDKLNKLSLDWGGQKYEGDFSILFDELIKFDKIKNLRLSLENYFNFETIYLLH
jgi:hypothetical protein